MPYSIRKVPKKNCYKLMNRNTKRVFSKCTTKENAKKQFKLLTAIKYNPNFVPRGRVRNNNSVGGGTRKKRKTYKKNNKL